MTIKTPPPPTAAPLAAKRPVSVPTLVWPIAALAIILLLNAGTFFHVDVRGGNLHGSLIDVLRNGSRTMLVSLGMTLFVGASGGSERQHFGTMGMALLVLFAVWLFLANALLLVGYVISLED